MAEIKAPPDGGRRAVTVVFASFLCNGLIFGFINTYSVLYEEIYALFQRIGVSNPASKASLIGSCTIGTTFLLSMISGIVSDRFGIRVTTFVGGAIACSAVFISSFFTDDVLVLFSTYGVLFGVGSSLAYIPSLTIIGHYFKKYIGIANGFVTVGSSTFSVAMPYILGYLLHTVGLNQCLRYMAAVLSTLMLCSLVFKPTYSPVAIKPVEEGAKSNFWQSIINMSIWKSKRFIVWVICIPVSLFGYFVPYVHMVEFLKKNYPGTDYMLPVTCVPLTSGIARLVFGYLSDQPKVNNIMLQQFSFVVIGIVTILVPLVNSYTLIIVLNLILGVCDGCFISVIGPIAFKLCGPKGASQAIGFLLGFNSFPITFGPVVAGWLYDKTLSYTVPFIVAGIPPIVGGIALTLVHFMEPNEVGNEWADAEEFVDRPTNV